MYILLVCEDFYHPRDVVEKGLTFLKDEYGHEIDIIQQANMFKADIIERYNIVIIVKANDIEGKAEKWMDNNKEELLKTFVELGGGLIVIHSGLAGYKNEKEYLSLTGGVFTHHPEQCQVQYNKIDEHDITSGVDSFNEIDEHYFIDIRDNNSRVLMESVSEHGSVPSAWIREVGEGRVFVFAGGHNLSVFQNPSCSKLLSNAVNWCGVACSE